MGARAGLVGANSNVQTQGCATVLVPHDLHVPARPRPARGLHGHMLPLPCVKGGEGLAFAVGPIQSGAHQGCTRVCGGWRKGAPGAWAHKKLQAREQQQRMLNDAHRVVGRQAQGTGQAARRARQPCMPGAQGPYKMPICSALQSKQVERDTRLATSDGSSTVLRPVGTALPSGQHMPV